MPTSLSRRRFLALSSAAAAGATFFDAPRVLRAAGLLEGEDPYRGFPMGAQSYSLRNFNTVEAVRHLQGMGLHYAEFYSKHLDPGANDDQLRETLDLLQSAEITLMAHGVHGFGGNRDANRRLFEFAKRAGVQTITANPEPESFDHLEELVEEFGIRIAIHNHGPGALYDSIASVKDAIAGRKNGIGACVDTGHFLRSNEDPVEAVRVLGERVYGVHVKDEAEKKPNSHNVVLGKGHLDLVGLFSALRDAKFPADGALSLEFEANPADPIQDMKDCLAAVREALAKLG